MTIAFRQTRLARALDRYRDSAGIRARAVMVEELARGMRRGDAPKVVAGRIRKRVQDVGVGRAMLIARTELMVAQWDGTKRDFQRDATVVGWTWVARLDGRTCLICRTMHGTRHTKQERIESHPNCRCAMSPRLEGFEPVADSDTGEARFARLPTAEQRRILGPARHALYLRGGSLGSMLARTRHPVYGGGRRIVPLRSLATPKRLASTIRAEARRLVAQARGDASQTQSDLRAIGAAHGGTLRGLRHQLKTEASMTTKIRNDARDNHWSPAYTAGRIYDALRYTYTLPASGYAAGIKGIRADLTARGYTHVRTKNFWGGNGQAAVQSVWLSPRGTFVEVQYHTPASLRTKQPSHVLYDKTKGLDPSTPRAKALAEQIRVLWAPVQRAAPPGVGTIRTEPP